MSAARAGGLALLAALLAACAEELEPRIAEGLAANGGVHVELGPAPAEVAFGAAFELTLVEAFERELVPEPFDERSLTPLLLEPRALGRRAHGGVIVLTRTFRARAFELGELELPAPALRARPRGGGEERVVRGQSTHLSVRSCLPQGDSGVPELPPSLGPGPRSGGRGVLGGAILVSLLALLTSALRPRRAVRGQDPPEDLAPPIPAHALAFARLERLTRLEPRSDPELERFHVELATTVREYLEARFALPAPRRTSAELLASPATAQALEPALLARLGKLLHGLDRALFAAWRPTPEERLLLLEAAIEIVHRTQAPEQVQPHPGATRSGRR